MKKKIIVVDDRPWKMKECILELQEEGIDFVKTVYYPNNMLDTERQNALMEDYRKSTGIEVVLVDNESAFVTQMDLLYKTPNVIFLMDYDLKGNMNRDDFLARINVRYALERDQKERKIWFYTSGPSDIRGLLRKKFTDRVIDTPFFSEGQLHWEKEQVKTAVEG